MQLDRKYVSFYYEDIDDFPEYDIDPKKTMLLLVDLQNQFCHLEGGDAKGVREAGQWDKWEPFYSRVNDVVIPNSRKLLDFFRENDLPVSFGRIACQRSDGEDRSPVQKSEGWNGIHLPKGTWASEMVDELTPIQDEIVVDKTTDSVTTGTNYLHILRNMGITTVVVGGIVTDQCVASTVRGLADDGLQVITVEDACAAADHDLHEAELKIMNVIYTYVMQTNEAIDLIKKEL